MIRAKMDKGDRTHMRKSAESIDIPRVGVDNCMAVRMHGRRCFLSSLGAAALAPFLPGCRIRLGRRRAELQLAFRGGFKGKAADGESRQGYPEKSV